MTRSRSHGGRILLLDDDARVRQLFQDCLTWLGHEVDAVASGPEALARLQARCYDLLLTDLTMAGMSGLEVAETARTLHPSLPIVMASGSATREDLDWMRERSIAFVCKPVDLHALEETIRGAVRGGTEVLA